MSKAINPQSYARVNPDAGSRNSGEDCTASSVNYLLIPLSHMAGRIVPIYTTQPAAHQTNADASETIGTGTTWDIPYYPTAGLWREDTEANLNGAAVGGFVGPVTEQFGPAFCVHIQGEITHPTTAADGLPEGLTLSAAVEWDDLSTQATETEALAAPFVAYRNRREDPRDVLDPHALSAVYGDIGPYNLTCRDIPGAELVGAGLTVPTAIQTGETGSEATDTGAHIDTEITLGDVGSSTASARIYVGGLTAYGINSEDADLSPNTSTGYTVIPGVNPFTTPFGGGTARSGQALTEVLRDLLHLDRTVYANRGQVLSSCWREESTSHTNPTAAFWTDDATNWTAAARGIFLRLPDVLPGSANVTGAGSGSTLAARGGFRARVMAQNCDVKIGVRKVTIAGTYGQTSTFGAWNFASSTHAAGSFSAVDVADDTTAVADHVLLPSGISPGDDYELCVWWRSSSSDAYLRGWAIWEPALTTVAP